MLGSLNFAVIHTHRGHMYVDVSNIQKENNDEYLFSMCDRQTTTMNNVH